MAGIVHKEHNNISGNTNRVLWLQKEVLHASQTVPMSTIVGIFFVLKDSPCCSVVEVLVFFGRLLVFGEFVLGNVGQVYRLRYIGMLTVERRHVG